MTITLQSLIIAAEKGGREVKKFFGKALDLDEKSTPGDFRTLADLESEKQILHSLMEQYPNFNYLSEERGLIDNGSEYTFVIDPLDGSNNFMLGIPNFSISIALMHQNQCILGVIHQPILNLTFYAEKGHGSFVNKDRLKVSRVSDIRQTTVAFACGYTDHSGLLTRLNRDVYQSGGKRFLTNWSTAFDFCLLSSGKIEILVNNKNEIYDFLAGKLIATEAGALITGLDGRPQEDDRQNSFVISNGTFSHQYILELIISGAVV